VQAERTGVAWSITSGAWSDRPHRRHRKGVDLGPYGFADCTSPDLPATGGWPLRGRPPPAGRQGSAPAEAPERGCPVRADPRRSAAVLVRLRARQGGENRAVTTMADGHGGQGVTWAAATPSWWCLVVGRIAGRAWRVGVVDDGRRRNGSPACRRRRRNVPRIGRPLGWSPERYESWLETVAERRLRSGAFPSKRAQVPSPWAW